MVTQAPAPVQYLRHSLLFLRKIHSEQTGDQNMNNTVWKSLGPEEIAHWTMSLRVWKHSLGRGSYSRASKTANLFGRTLTRSILWRPSDSKSPPRWRPLGAARLLALDRTAVVWACWATFNPVAGLKPACDCGKQKLRHWSTKENINKYVRVRSISLLCTVALPTVRPQTLWASRLGSKPHE